MKKVLLIAFYFNQMNEIASKRLRALAKYLSEFGWEPIVLVPDLGFIPSENDNLNCEIVYTDYEDMFSKYLNKIKLFNTKNSGTNHISNNNNNNNNNNSNSNNSNNNNNNNFDVENTVSKNVSGDKLKDSNSVNNKLLSKAISYAGEVFAYPDGMKFWYDPAMDVASNIIEKKSIDAIISSSWPITAHIIAKNLKDKYDVPWIADLRDLWNMNPYVSHNFIRNTFEKKLEINTFKNVDVLTTTTELAASTLNILHPDTKIVSIPSGFDPDDFKILENSANNSSNLDINDNVKDNSSITNNFEGNDNNNNNNNNNNNYLNENNFNEDKLKFIYAGSLYGGKRDPNLLFKAIYQLNNEKIIDLSKISIDFYGDSGNLLEIAKTYGLESIVNVGGYISHEDVLKKQKTSDILLLISWNDEKEKMFIPGKVYEYMALKRPVLSIGYKKGSLKDLIEKTNIGYHVSDLESIKNVITKYYMDFIEKGYLEYGANDYVNDYSMINMSKSFGELLDNITN